MFIPNMAPEIIDAIHNTYKGYDDIEVDCYLCLMGLEGEVGNKLSEHAREAIEKMNRCIKCGERLELAQYKEHHNELDDNSYEMFYEFYCPKCDKRGGDID